MLQGQVGDAIMKRVGWHQVCTLHSRQEPDHIADQDYEYGEKGTPTDKKDDQALEWIPEWISE